MINEQLMSGALDALADGVVVVAAGDKTTNLSQSENPIIFVNPAFEIITGYLAEEVMGQDCRFLYAKDQDQDGLAVLRQAMSEGKGCAVRLRNYRKDGTMFWNDLTISVLRDENNHITHYIGLLKDVTERELLRQELVEVNNKYQELNKRLELETETDQLTRVYNRRFMDTVGRMIFETAKRQSLYLSLYLVDLDNFKLINDEYGHKAGDQYLQQISESLQKFFGRVNDVIIRYGGDEFIVLAIGESPQKAKSRGVQLCQFIEEQSGKFSKTFKGGTVSVGIAASKPGAYDTLEKYVKIADDALYQSKENGRNQATLG